MLTVQAFDILSSLIQVSPSEHNSYQCDNYTAIVSNADLLFKWLTIRMMDNNVQSTNSLVTFLVTLLDMLRHNGYTMTDGEASILLPSLIERVRRDRCAITSLRSCSARRNFSILACYHLRACRLATKNSVSATAIAWQFD